MINIQEIFKSIRSLLCLNGEIPEVSFFRKYRSIPLIACDGAGSNLINIGIYPNLIVGDLDSIDYKIVSNKVKFLRILNQNYTDFEKAINILVKRKLFPCLICGATGKETDHTIYNIYTILKHSKQHLFLLYDSADKHVRKYGVFVLDELFGQFEIGSTISILPFPEAIVSTSGLKWNLNNELLSQTGRSSVRNKVKSTLVKVKIVSGVVFLMFEHYE